MKSIFKKLFVFYMITLMVSLVLIIMSLTHIFYIYFENQSKDILLEQGEKIVDALEQSYYWGGFFDRDKLSKEIEMFDEYFDTSFVYIDPSCKIAIVSNDLDSSLIGETIINDDIKKVVSGEITEMTGNLEGIYKKTVLTVGYPVKIKGESMGAIFMSSSFTQIQEYVNNAHKIIIGTILAIALLGFVVIYFLYKSLTKPLREINKVAKVMANGDFEKRISIKGSDEVAELAKSLNNMAENLAEQEKKRREFISNISHDLRSPLTSMKGFVQAIIDGTIPQEKHEHYLKIVLDESERLASLADNMVNINSLDKNINSLDLSEFDINKLIKKTIFNFETRIVNKKINLKFIYQSKVIFVKADYEKIQRVIYNLLDNAVKFSNVGGEIFIETEKKDKKVFVHVRDTGRGVSEEDKKRIFDRFYKADVSRGEDKKGNGIGLSIVQEFIVAHGEVITLNSELNKGCEFIFSLPYVKK